MYPEHGGTERARLEALIVADARALTAESEQAGRAFAAVHRVRPSDFRALLHILVAERAGSPLTSGELRHKMGLSAAAITYLVERMIKSGHIRRDSEPADRRKVILRYADGRDIAGSFLAVLAAHNHAAMAALSVADLTAGHGVLTALIDAAGQFQAQLRILGADV